MKLTKDQIDTIISTDQIDTVIFALNREIDLERMNDEEIIEFAKQENGVDTDYIIRLQEIVNQFKKQKEKSNAND
tara:strand:- start:124 stop:348 length:225 start_codon:yes stop_codon:yes gene_type:complete